MKMMSSATSASSHLRRDQIVNGVKVKEIVEIFETLGYECKVNSELVGASGVKHPFDIVAKRDSEMVVLDIVSLRASILDTPASDVEVTEKLQIAGIAMRAKAWDCGVYQRFIVYLSSYLAFNEGVQGSKYDPYELFLQQSNIQIVKSTDARTAAEKLQNLLGAEERNNFSDLR